MDHPGANLGTEVSEASRLVTRQIISGQLLPGQRIKIRELAAQSGIGPTTMREGVSRLVGCGFVLAFDQRGYRVSELNAADLAVILLLKEALEAALSREALVKADTSWRTNVLGVLHRLERARLSESANADFPWALYEADKAFHFALLSGCGSPLGMRMWSGFYDQCVRYMVATAFSGSVGHFIERVQSIDEHRNLVQAFTAGDGASALEALARHNVKDMAGISLPLA